MKKIVTLGMVVVMSTALCFSVYADNNSTNAAQRTIANREGTVTVSSAKPMKLETKTIKGTIKEINDFGIKINAEDNKVYVIPTAMIAETAEFKSLKLKAGDIITAEGPDFEKMKGLHEISFSIDEDGTASKEDVHISKAVPAVIAIRGEGGAGLVQSFEKADLIELKENESFFPAEKITANGVTIEFEKLLPKHAAIDAIKVESKTIKGTVKEVNKYGIKVKGEDNKVYVIPIGIFEKTDEFKSMKLKAGDSITVEGPDFEKMQSQMKNQKDIVYFGTPAVANIKAESKILPNNTSLKDENIIVKEFDKAEAFKLEKDETMFPAEKITANGVTIDINKLMMEFGKPIQIRLAPKN